MRYYKLFTTAFVTKLNIFLLHQSLCCPKTKLRDQKIKLLILLFIHPFIPEERPTTTALKQRAHSLQYADFALAMSLKGTLYHKDWIWAEKYWFSSYHAFPLIIVISIWVSANTCNKKTPKCVLKLGLFFTHVRYNQDFNHDTIVILALWLFQPWY